jgi:multidrug efflux pump subunit AcrA (membrane-fusion protein)
LRYLLVAITFSVSVFFFGAHSQAAVEAPKPAAVVFARTVKAEELFDRLTYPARVTPKVSTTILSETDGIVSTILAPLGQAVRKHQKIMTITHTDPVYQYAPTPVFAPVAGVVSSVDVTEGTQVSRGEKLALVTDPGKIRINVEVPAMDLALLSRGLEGEFKLQNLEKPIQVKIRGISPFVDPATGTATCELEIAEILSAPLPAGMIGQASFKANDRKGISIPEYAVFYKGTDTFVRVVKDGKAKQVAVVLGKRSRGNVEVLKGVADGAQIVERTSRFISDDEAVTVQDSGASGTGGQGTQ